MFYKCLKLFSTVLQVLTTVFLWFYKYLQLFFFSMFYKCLQLVSTVLKVFTTVFPLFYKSL